MTGVRGGCRIQRATLADDVILTYRVTESKLEIGVLDGEGDLDLWARLADDGILFATAGELRTRYTMQSGPLPPGTSTGIYGPEGCNDPYKG